jgi:NAD(P)-dependent dehydrogenase (short-subunit alcohol dehydrogenase family)
MDDFVGKVALITGAGRGVGREIALAFSSLGAVVAANDINPINLDETVNQITGIGGISKGYVFDIAKRMPIEAMVTQLLDHFGHIDILVNHASVKPDASILDMDEWEFHRTLDVNLGGPFFCTQQVGRVMRQQGGGAIVNIASAFKQRTDLNGHAAYLASQVGLLGLTTVTASELSAYNIRLNTVWYGATGMDLVAPQSWDTDIQHQWQESVPMALLGDHPDLVNLVLFLCSASATSLTGQILSIESGNND